MLCADAPIGVLDAGFGGYTVVKELQKILPNENIMFYGDGKNQPYGNRSKRVILDLIHQCLAFFQEKNVKVVAVGCNTISTLIDEYQDEFPFKIISIVRAGSDTVIKLHPKKIILFSTVFTAQSGCYEQYIHTACPDIQVIPRGSKWLARLIEDGDFDLNKIEHEIQNVLDDTIAQQPDIDSLILGCTHFPLVKDIIQDIYPNLKYLINPAVAQAMQVKEYLLQVNGLRKDGDGSIHIYTTSDCDVYTNMAKLLGLHVTSPVSLVPAPVPLKE
ncbi:glutamate racemase [Flintibacter sp. HCN-6482]|uniref:glutamate racemase n=1 Tax=Flintibacter sp. HCN-6482 TaxID=3134672 RepID=UPI0030BEFF73